MSSDIGAEPGGGGGGGGGGAAAAPTAGGIVADCTGAAITPTKTGRGAALTAALNCGAVEGADGGGGGGAAGFVGGGGGGMAGFLTAGVPAAGATGLAVAAFELAEGVAAVVLAEEAELLLGVLSGANSAPMDE